MDEQPPQDAPPPATRNDRTFQLNPPTLICLLYAATYFTAVSALIGVVLAYVWRREGDSGWEETHYTYLIRTFWLAVIGIVAGFVLLFAFAVFGEALGPRQVDFVAIAVVVGVLLALGLTVLLMVRCALSLVAAQRNRPMQRPRSWTI